MYNSKSFKVKRYINYKYESYLMKIRSQDLDPLFENYKDYMIRKKRFVNLRECSNIDLAIGKARLRVAESRARGLELNPIFNKNAEDAEDDVPSGSPESTVSAGSSGSHASNYFTDSDSNTEDADQALGNLTGPRLLEFLLKITKSAKEILLNDCLTPAERFDSVETLMILASGVEKRIFKKWLLEIHFNYYNEFISAKDALKAPYN